MNTQEVIEWVDDRLQTTKQRAASGATVTAEIFRYQIEILSSIRSRLIAAEKMREALAELLSAEKLDDDDPVLNMARYNSKIAMALYDAATGETR